ncbi:MAG: 4Fe-4S dicluster domain-containing protein [Crenarchaeota archaeon]|nr:4Fe-4S dicluster domain-containing protein [Thermoproteota archaeon]
MVEVLLLEERDTLFSNYPKLKGDLKEALKRGSVVVVGPPEKLVEAAREAAEGFWYRLFLCHKGCPEEVVKTLAELAEHWTPYYAIKFERPSGKVTRREAIQAIVKRGIRGRWVALPENTFACASPKCVQCKLVCPTDAIRLKAGRVSIDPDKCISCGLCVAACPLYSLDMPGLAPNELLGAIPPSKAEVAERVVWKAPLQLTPEDFTDRTLVLLGIPIRAQIVVDYFTKVLGWEFCDAKGCISPSKKEPAPCQHSLPDDLSPLVAIKMSYSLDPKFEVYVDPRLCDACTACSEACPTRSLMLKSPTMTTSMLLHLPAACVGCNACVRACPVQRKIDSLGLGIRMIRVVEKEESECKWKELVKKSHFRPQCAVCGRHLRIDPETYLKRIDEFLSKNLLELEEIYTPESFLEKSEELLRIMLCEDCYKRYKAGLLPPATVAKLVLLTLGCLYEQEGARRGWIDPLRVLWALRDQLEIGGFNACSELAGYRAIFSLSKD